MQSSLFAYKAGTSLLFCCRSARKESDKESTDTAPLIAKRVYIYQTVIKECAKLF